MFRPTKPLWTVQGGGGTLGDRREADRERGALSWGRRVADREGALLDLQSA